VDEFLEYLNFVDPEIEEAKIRVDVSPVAMPDMDVDAFEHWFLELAPRLPPGTVDTLLLS